MAINMNDLFQKIKNVTRDFEHEQQAAGVIVAFDVALAGDAITVQPTDLYAPMPDDISADAAPTSGRDEFDSYPKRKGPANDPLKDRKGL